MFKKTIRGGQVAMHRLQMFKQVFAKSMKWGAVLGLVIVSSHVYLFKRNDLHVINARELISYGKVYFLQQLDQIITPLRQTLGGDSKQVTMVDYWTRYGERRMSIRVAVHDNALVRNFFYCKKFVLQEFQALTIGFFSSILAIFGLWWWFGGIQEEEKTDNRYLTAKEAAKLLKRKNLASWLKIGELPLIKDAETKHILIAGVTGSGKTNLLKLMISQITGKSQRAIVIDQTGEMISRYYDKNRGDIIFNPFSSQGLKWDFFSEMANESILHSFATTMFASNINNHDPMWGEAARQVFVDAVSHLKNAGATSGLELYDFLSKSEIKGLRESLAGTISGKYLDPANEKTWMSILSTLLTRLGWLKLVGSHTDVTSFTIRQFMQAQDQSWLFISSTPETRTILQPLQSALLDLATVNLMNLGIDDSNSRRVWFILDELASLSKLIALPRGLAELRKYGGCVVAGLQSLHQLTTIYSYAEARTMQSQFNTQIYFRIGDPELAKMISNGFGETLHHKQQESISYGAHEMRDGVQLGHIERIKPLLPESELLSLRDLECFVALPNPDIRLVRLQIPYAKL